MKEIFTYRGMEYSYEIIKKKVKRISIRIDEKGQIKVTLPLFVEYDKGRQFVLEKREWIVKQYQKIQEEQEKRGDFSNKLEENSKLYYCGKPLSLHFVIRKSARAVRVEKVGERIVITGPKLSREEKIMALTGWFRNMAKIRITKRVEDLGQKMGLSFGTVRIKDQKSRWGSCSSRKNLNFNWRLIMAPDEVLDYVVIHELSHLKEMNHSVRFWNLVAQWMPDYKVQEQWLKENAAKLYFE